MEFHTSDARHKIYGEFEPCGFYFAAAVDFLLLRQTFMNQLQHIVRTAFKTRMNPVEPALMQQAPLLFRPARHRLRSAVSRYPLDMRKLLPKIDEYTG